MQNLLKKIAELKDSEISIKINERIREFEKIRDDELFEELCFCLMTANYRADKCIEIQKKINKSFKTLSIEKLSKILKNEGHRFWPQRAERIVLARENISDLENLRKTNPGEARNWLVKNIKGLGLKESSHFLRNIGIKDLSIIDFHIVDLLVKENLIEKPRTLNPKKYEEIEKVLKEIAGKSNLNLAELDLYLWYIETGNVLK